MPGLFEKLGSFGRRVISIIRETGRSISEAVRFARPISPEITLPGAARDFGTVSRLEELARPVAAVHPRSVIPDYLHVPTAIPFNRDYAYTITIQGRAVAGRIGPGGVKVGGRFTRDEFNITSNRQLTPNEAIDIATGRFGAGGTYALVSIRNISVTAAFSRE